jgi:hypothetical protein
LSTFRNQFKEIVFLFKLHSPYQLLIMESDETEVQSQERQYVTFLNALKSRYCDEDAANDDGTCRYDAISHLLLKTNYVLSMPLLIIKKKWN